MCRAELNRFYYDTAQVSLVGTLAALAKLVPVSQIVYGTDFPYRTAAEHTKGVATVFSGDDLDEGRSARTRCGCCRVGLIGSYAGRKFAAAVGWLPLIALPPMGTPSTRSLKRGGAGGRLLLVFAAVPYSFDAERGRGEENVVPRGRAGYRRP